VCREFREKKEERHKKRLERQSRGIERSQSGRRRADSYSATQNGDLYDYGPRYLDGNPYSTTLPAPPVGPKSR
jgi:hypothetical protein